MHTWASLSMLHDFEKLGIDTCILEGFGNDITTINSLIYKLLGHVAYICLQLIYTMLNHEGIEFTIIVDAC